MIYRLLLSMFSLLTLYNCANDDVVLECVCAAKEFSVELVNSEGNNLITNETYILNDISVKKKGTQSNIINLDNAERITFSISENEGDIVYEIKLNDSETDSLVLNLVQIDEGGCCGPIFSVNSANYNNQIIEIDRGSNVLPYDDKIVVTK